MSKLTHPIDGVALKRWRGRRIKTHTQLARAAGVSEASIRIYEAGGARVHASTLLRLAEALDIAPDDIRLDEYESSYTEPSLNGDLH